MSLRIFHSCLRTTARGAVAALVVASLIGFASRSMAAATATTSNTNVVKIGIGGASNSNSTSTLNTNTSTTSTSSTNTTNSTTNTTASTANSTTTVNVTTTSNTNNTNTNAPTNLVFNLNVTNEINPNQITNLVTNVSTNTNFGPTHANSAAASNTDTNQYYQSNTNTNVNTSTTGNGVGNLFSDTNTNSTEARLVIINGQVEILGIANGNATLTVSPYFPASVEEGGPSSQQTLGTTYSSNVYYGGTVLGYYAAMYPVGVNPNYSFYYNAYIAAIKDNTGVRQMGLNNDPSGVPGTGMSAASSSSGGANGNGPPPSGSGKVTFPVGGPVYTVTFPIHGYGTQHETDLAYSFIPGTLFLQQGGYEGMDIEVLSFQSTIISGVISTDEQNVQAGKQVHLDWNITDNSGG